MKSMQEALKYFQKNGKLTVVTDTEDLEDGTMEYSFSLCYNEGLIRINLKETERVKRVEDITDSFKKLLSKTLARLSDVYFLEKSKLCN